jgi:hypothetical protein
VSDLVQRIAAIPRWYLLVGVALVAMEVLFRFEYLGAAIFLPSAILAIIFGYSSGEKSRTLSSYAAYISIFLPCMVVGWIPVHMVSEIVLRVWAHL